MTSEVKDIFDSYPKEMKDKLLELRQLILEVGEESDEISTLDETLKWEELSYLCKTGSTIRLAWHKKTPDQYAMYFNCKTKLIATFRELFSDTLNFEGNRAIVFTLKDKIPVTTLKYCILLALSYHKRKHLCMLDT
ncbi:DUF1801 domain-containing protein [Sulfurimonas sp. MAG313]|nr:DUF1801 domain-containing protein [Sulfurimonas sp. MAG313]MDF1881987.1 DUF1801 domain-containing protein [Sulfurimonas sp. MAG313]